MFQVFEFSYEITTWFPLFWLRILNVFLVDRIINKAWLDIIRFVVVIWSNQFRVRKQYRIVSASSFTSKVACKHVHSFLVQ